MDTPLNRVENLLQNGDALYIHQIVKQAGITEKAAKASIKTLSSMGQIEVIPTPGRWGNRYAWLSTKPVAAEPPAIPEEELVAGVQEAITGSGSGEALPEIPMLEGTPSEAIIKAFAESGLQAPSVPSAFRELVEAQAMAVAPTRWAVAVPKRALRVVRSRERAEALALAAVRRGAKGAEVFALTTVGRAKRDATFQEAGSHA